MKAPTIISGCPGSGKTTLASRLAARSESAVHIETDKFYDFLSHRIDPSTPESRVQNTAVTHSFLHAAKPFVAAEYDVYVDGVIGPWWLETIQQVFTEFDYIILNADLESVLKRTEQRAPDIQPSLSPLVVRKMHQQFAEIIHDHGAHVIETAGRSLDAVINEFDRRQVAGDFSMSAFER